MLIYVYLKYIYIYIHSCIDIWPNDKSGATIRLGMNDPKSWALRTS